MDRANQWDNLEVLLSHGAFVRGLALRLLRDEHLADDMTQETWIAALKNPPSHSGALRSWLATVVSNFSRMRIREKRMRSDKERVAAAPESVRPTDEIVETEMMRTHLVKAVLSLKEPYLSTILFRFYDDLPPREIAKRCDVPVETVKTRLQRGLEQLRRKLDGHYGKRERWSLALVPLVGLDWAPRAGAAVTMDAAAGSGGAVIKASALKAMAALLLLLVPASLIWYLHPGDEAADVRGTESIRVIDRADEAVIRTGSIESDFDAASPRDVAAIETDRTKIRGRVIDRISEEPIARFDLKIDRMDGESDEFVSHLHETVRNDAGSFEASLPRPGAYRIAIHSSRYKMKTLPRIELGEATVMNLFDIRLDPGLVVRGQVVDRTTGRPVAGALVGSDRAHDPLSPAFGHQLSRGYDEFDVHAVTDDAGRFRLSGLDDAPQRIAAIAPGYAQGWVDYVSGNSSELLLQLEEGFLIHGTVLDDDGDPVEGIPVQMRGESFPLQRCHVSDEEGRFTSGPVLPGYVSLWVEPWLDRLETTRFTAEAICVEIVDRDVQVEFGPKAGHHASLEAGIRIDPAIFPDACLCLDPRWRTTDHSGLDLSHCYGRKVRLDEAGECTIRKLPVGTYLARCMTAGRTWTYSVDLGLFSVTRPGKVVHTFPFPHGKLAGVVKDGVTGEPITNRKMVVLAHPSPLYSFHQSQTETDGAGRFEFLGLEDGTYDLTAGDPEGPGVWGEVRGVELAQGMKTPEVEIAIPEQGTLKLIFQDFGVNEINHLDCSLVGSTKTKNFEALAVVLTGDGSRCEYACGMETGVWDLTVILQGDSFRGAITRTLEIEAERCTELILSRWDMKAGHPRQSLQGIVKWADGRPASGTKLLFSCDDLIGQSSYRDCREADVDEEGRFEVFGLTPDLWKAFVRFQDGTIVFLEDIAYSESRGHYWEPEVVIPSGELSARLIDGITGETPDTHGYAWRISLMTPMALDRPLSLQQIRVLKSGTHPLKRFHLKGLVSGHHCVTLDLPGYALNEREIPGFAEGESRNLGVVSLAPCGLVELEFQLEDDHAITSFSLVCNDEVFSFGWPGTPIRKLDANRFLCDKLPLGTVHLKIDKKGYACWEERLELAPGQCQKISIPFRIE